MPGPRLRPAPVPERPASRKRRGAAGAVRARADAGAEAPAAGRARPAGYARMEARNAAVREGLEPLAPGERPRALTVAATVAGTIGALNLVLALAGREVAGQEPSLAFTLVFSGVMLGVAVFMWQRRYWAVLAFQVILGVTVSWAGLSLLVASNVAGVLVSFAVLLGGGALFWKLIRPMARMQAPPRGSTESIG